MTEEAKATYEARYCPGMPTDCCDYGVISHETGKEVCRVWDRDDAERIAGLLNTRQPTPAADEVELDHLVLSGIDKSSPAELKADAVRLMRRAKQLETALQARSAEPASNPCKLPAEPAGEEPVGYTGSGSLDGIKHGLEGSIWGTPEASHPIPLYARPATPTKTERLVEAEGIETVDEDWLTDVINDSIDMDWTGRVGAKAIMRELAKLQEQRIEAKVCHVCGAKGREDHAGHCSESW